MHDLRSTRRPSTGRKASAGPGQTSSALILPQLLTPLFGRADDLRGLQTLMSRQDARLITLTGAPGIGKTRLAIAVSHDWQRTTGNDVYFAQLASIRDPSLVLLTIALGLNIQHSKDAPLIDRLATRLRDRPSLLVLDNFEQILAAATEVVDLLVRSPNLRIIVTSRSALRVRGEHEWSVLPLKLPKLDEAMHSMSIEENPSVALLLDRAQSVQAGPALTPEHSRAMASIVVRLEGIPLAIELAAPWLRLFSPADLLERLSSGLDLLQRGARDLPDRQQTLTNAIRWSDNLLDPIEQRLFHRLSVFSDGWTLDAAEALCVDENDDLTTEMVPQFLAVLLDKSLIYRVPDADDPARFSMLEMIRDYALRRLGEDGSRAEVQQRHAAYYRGLVAAAVPHLYREDQAAWLERLEREKGNLRMALRWLIDGAAKQAALHLAFSLENFWLLHDHLGEGRRWLEECLAMDGGSYPASEAKARRTLATLLMRRGDYARAEQLHQQTLTFAREVSDERLRAESLLDLGSLHFIAGDLSAATELFKRALWFGDWLQEQRIVARALNQLGELDRYHGHDASALGHYEASLDLWRRLAERERIAMVLHNLAPVVGRLGDRQRAIELFSESLSISWELGNLHGLAICLAGIPGIIDPNTAAALDGARLLGAADAFRDSIEVQWQPVDRAEFERSRTHLSDALTGDAFSAAFNDGARMTAREAFHLAMEILDSARVTVGAREHAGSGRIRGALSRREFGVAEQVARGLTNREIAERLDISEKTVEMHVSNALRKLGLRSRLQLASWLEGHHRRLSSESTSMDSSHPVDQNTGDKTGASLIF